MSNDSSNNITIRNIHQMQPLIFHPNGATLKLLILFKM